MAKLEGILKKIANFNFCEKWAWPSTPLRAEKILKVFIDFKLHNGEGILKKIANFNFCEKIGVALHAPQGDPTSLKKF